MRISRASLLTGRRPEVASGPPGGQLFDIVGQEEKRRRRYGLQARKSQRLKTVCVSGNLSFIWLRPDVTVGYPSIRRRQLIGHRSFPSGVSEVALNLRV